MTAQDYPVTFGYKAQDGTFYGKGGSVGLYHRGNDRSCPIGVPVVIEDTVIGATGVSGVTSGPHLHIQAMKNGSDINPKKYEFKPGKVIATGYHHQFGYFVRLLVEGVEVIYAHLSFINVLIGQKVGRTMPKEKDVKDYFRIWEKRSPTKRELKDYTSKNWRYLFDKILAAQRGRYMKEIATLKAQQNDTSDANAIGKAIIPVLAKIGFKKGK